MKNNLVGISVAVVCAVVIIGTILVPTIADASETETTFENEFSYYAIKNPESATIDWDGTTMQIDGETIDVPDSTENPYGVSLFSKIDGVIRYNTDGSVIKWGAIGSYNTGAITSMDLEIADGYLTGTIVISSTDIELNVELTGDYYILSADSDAENVITVSDGNLYVLGDSFVRSNGISKTDNNVVNGVVVFDVSGTIDDGFTIDAYNRNGGAELTNITYSDITAHYTEVDGYNDLYMLEKVTFTTTVTDSDDNEITANHSYDYFFAPVEVTAELTNHLSESEISLLSIIPMFVILAVLCAVTYAVMRNRD